MPTIRKIFHVVPNQIGYLYRDNKFEKKLNPGRYVIWDFSNRIGVICLPTTTKLIVIQNQEVLTKDNIAFRCSLIVLYKIVDSQKFLENFELNKPINMIINEAEQHIYNTIQIYLREQIAQFDSENINEQRGKLVDFKNEEIIKQLAKFGITIEDVELKDITFPKSIQDLFAKGLEAKIRAKADLENARTAVATARTLKNASEIMKDDDNIKFFQWLETINKIAAKGKHTFMLGDVQPTVKKDV